jgi:hypothetical protein
MREIRPSGSVRGVRRKPYPYRDANPTDAEGSAGIETLTLTRNSGPGAYAKRSLHSSGSQNVIIYFRRQMTFGLLTTIRWQAYAAKRKTENAISLQSS